MVQTNSGATSLAAFGGGTAATFVAMPGAEPLTAPTESTASAKPTLVGGFGVMPGGKTFPAWVRGAAGVLLLCLMLAGIGRSARLSREVAFVYAARIGDVEGTRAFLEAGGDANALGGAALASASRHSDRALMCLLLSHHADPNSGTDAAALHGQASALHLLLAYGAQIKGERGGSLLCSAAQSGDTDTVYLLLKQHVPLETRSAEEGMTPLMYAARSGRAGVVYALAANGAKASARSVRGRTPLMYAALWNQPTTVRYLLSYGADLNARDEQGRTPLMLAVSARKVDMVDYLLACGASTGAKDHSGRTAFLLSQKEGDARMTNRLRRAAAAATKPVAPKLAAVR